MGSGGFERSGGDNKKKLFMWIKTKIAKFYKQA